MPKTINLTGKENKTYDLEELDQKETRSNSNQGLVVQVWKWNPEFAGDHSKPNPPNLVLGQIWLSKFISSEDPDFSKLKKEFASGGN